MKRAALKVAVFIDGGYLGAVLRDRFGGRRIDFAKLSDRMAVEDLHNQSRVLRNPRSSNYRVVSFVDGGFPFVFWWRNFLTDQEPGSRFSLQNTPIYGVTSGDEYYPLTSMAGNIAYITSTVSGMTYPHGVNELPKMSISALNAFYSEFCERVSTPTFHKRVLFVGSIFRDLQYGIPFILHLQSDHRTIYEPLRLKWRATGTLRSFYSTFGYYPQNDLVVVGTRLSNKEKTIVRECEDTSIECRNVSDFLDGYVDLLQRIEQESNRSNLSPENVRRISKSIRRSERITRRSLQEVQ